MKEFCIETYGSLQQELKELNKTKPVVQQIEASFTISVNYWMAVTKKLASYQFTDIREEILFFKKIKPLFTSQIEYYKLLYHFYLFKPDHDRKRLEAFIRLEKSRLKKLVQANAGFYVYYKNKATHLDMVYFTRMPAPGPSLLSKSYNFHPCLISSHDHLVSLFMAVEKYTAWCKKLQRKKPS